MIMKKAVITGIYGQDGSFICEKLLKEKYKIYGIVKEELSENAVRIQKELWQLQIEPEIRKLNIYDYRQICQFIKEVEPDEIYHMAAYHVSSEGKGNANIIREQEVFNNNVLATANILEACYQFSPHTRILTAGSCLMYDASESICQTEKTPFYSKSLYGLAKISENLLVKYYREKGLFACTAILYNHESHRRASQFVTKKIVENMVKIKKGEIDKFLIGSLDTKKDWGYAGDYADAMYLMLQNALPKDFIVSTGELHSIRDFFILCAKELSIENWESHIIVNDKLVTRQIKGQLRGDNSAIRKELLWERKMTFKDIVREMINYEVR